MLCNHGLLIYLNYTVYVAIKKNPMKEQDLNKDHLLPVQMVSADHYISWDPVRLYHTKGKPDPSDMF